MRSKLTITVLTSLAAGLLLTAVLTAAGASADGGPPAFVQQVSVHSSSVASVKLTPTSAITAGNRIVVVVGIWNSSAATAKSVTDSAGNSYTEVLHFKASDNTEQSVWTAPITAGGGTKPAITVTPTSKADVGAIASEYSGLSTAAGTGRRRPEPPPTAARPERGDGLIGRDGRHQRLQRAGHRHVRGLGLR